MKKSSICLLLFTLTVLLAACGSTPSQTTAPPAHNLTLSMEELLNQVVQEQPVEFTGGVTSLDLTDTSENGLWLVQSATGLEDASVLTEAAVFEPMIGSIPFSLVMVRVAPEADPEAVAADMLAGVDPAKWVCVSADDVLVAGYGDVVMLVMVSTDYDLTAQSYADAFQAVAGGALDFVIS